MSDPSNPKQSPAFEWKLSEERHLLYEIGLHPTYQEQHLKDAEIHVHSCGYGWSRWAHPLFVAIFATALAILPNAGVARFVSSSLNDLDDSNHKGNPWFIPTQLPTIASTILFYTCEIKQGLDYKTFIEQLEASLMHNKLGYNIKLGENRFILTAYNFTSATNPEDKSVFFIYPLYDILNNSQIKDAEGNTHPLNTVKIVILEKKTDIEDEQIVDTPINASNSLTAKDIMPALVRKSLRELVKDPSCALKPSAEAFKP